MKNNNTENDILSDMVKTISAEVSDSILYEEKHIHQVEQVSKAIFPISDLEIASLINNLSFSFDDIFFDLPMFSGENVPYKINKSFDYANLEKSIGIEKIRKDFPILQEKMYGRQLVWLDNAATSQKPQSVISAMNEHYSHKNSNIHRGNYKLSIEASEAYENTRKQVANFINATSEQEIIFVRGTTEGINLISAVLGKKNHLLEGDEVIISMIEHHSNILPWQALCEAKGAILKVIPIDNNGDICIEHYSELLSHKTKIVALSQVSNALGTVLPIKEMCRMAHHYGAYVLVDAAQSIPHFKLDVADLDCDFAVFSGHKMFAPMGIGVVYGKQAILETLPPWQLGGGMIDKVSFDKSTYAASPYRFEAGTPSVADVVGLDAAIQYITHVGYNKITAYEHALMHYATQRLNAIPHLSIIGNPKFRTGSLPFIMNDISLQEVGNYLDKKGIALRIGHHCAQPTMKFFGVESMIRPSFAFYNTFKEIDYLAESLESLSNTIK